MTGSAWVGVDIGGQHRTPATDATAAVGLGLIMLFAVIFHLRRGVPWVGNVLFLVLRGFHFGWAQEIVLERQADVPGG